MRHPVLAALAVLAVYFPVALYVTARPGPTMDPTIMQRPFYPRVAPHAWLSYHLVPYAKADSDAAPRQSTVQLYEDGRPLGPAHSYYLEVGSLGQGRFSFVQDGRGYVIFSTSDNSDPNTNGRTYRAIDPEARDPYLAPSP